MRSFLPLRAAMANPWLFFSLLFFFFIFVSVAKEQGEFHSPYFSRLYEIHERERRPASVQETAVHGLLLRLLPSHASSFQFRIISKEKCNGKVCFIIRNHPSGNQDASPEIIIEGVTGVEISAGLHWYLKYFCSAHISWEKTGGAQLNTVPNPGSLPPIPHDRICVQRPVEWSYYQNAVASSYSFAWWDWERWEKEIDWMALQGINLPLAFTGQEAIWQKVLQKFNFSTSDLDDFFGGPAFLAWSRMSNLHGWGGPLPQTWLNFQLVLQKKILERMYDFGMTPVLPAFSGNVPAAIKLRFPNARVTQLGNWFSVNSNTRWCCTYLLDPTDPLFVDIGRSFIEQQIKEYGKSSHIYNCDTFDENTPPSDNPHYISSLGAAIYKGMQSGDSDAVWLMQGWLFSYDPFWNPPQMKALLHSVPIGRMVVLDLYAEVKPIWSTSNHFYGVPYIWCMLHNFAANNEMYGVLEAVALEPIKARSSYNSTIIGVGMCMEGIEQNPVVYDLMSEMAFRHDPVDVEEWLHLYSTRRYGKQIKGLQYAWKILLHTLYNCTDGAYNKNRDVIVAFPDVEPSVILKEEKLHTTCAGNNFLVQKLAEGNSQDDTSEVTYEKPHIWYSTADVIRALQIFLENGDEVSDIPTFRYDLVDLTRQALAKYANEVFLKALEGYRSNDLTKVNFHSQHFLELVEDLDMLLASHDGFLLGPWLESAKNLATGSDQTKQDCVNSGNAGIKIKNQLYNQGEISTSCNFFEELYHTRHELVRFEWNARTQITMWYDNLETKASLLRDYGNKYWSGLLRDYYGPRAKIYVECLLYSMQTGKSFPLQDWRRDWINLTNSWQKSKEVYPIKATGSAYNISQWIFDKYLSGTGSYLQHELSSSSF